MVFGLTNGCGSPKVGWAESRAAEWCRGSRAGTRSAASHAAHGSQERAANSVQGVRRPCGKSQGLGFPRLLPPSRALQHRAGLSALSGSRLWLPPWACPPPGAWCWGPAAASWRPRRLQVRPHACTHVLRMGYRRRHRPPAAPASSNSVLAERGRLPAPPTHPHCCCPAERLPNAFPCTHRRDDCHRHPKTAGAAGHVPKRGSQV